jgi:predicted peptidase
MKTPTVATLSLVAGLLAPSLPMLMAQNPQNPLQLQQEKSFEGKITRSAEVRYLLFLPQGYAESASQEWPLILFLHGAGERGTDLAQVARHGPPRIVADRPELPFIVVSPQCPSGQRWDSDVLLALLDEVQRQYRVDPKRVYLTGLSMGGYGTWNLGLAHPERFAAIAPICGGGDRLLLLLGDPRKRKALQSLPVWAFHGAKDPVVRLEESENMVNALRQIGATNVQLTVYPDAQHDSWTETYANPKLYDWFLQHTRRP